MRGLKAFSVVALGALSLSGCGGLEAPGAPSPLSSAAGVEADGTTGQDGTVGAMNYGTDEVPGTCNAGKSIVPNGSPGIDEINTPTDADAYVFTSNASMHTYQFRATGENGTGVQVDCRLYYRTPASYWILLSADTDGNTCDLTYVITISRTFCIRLTGHNGESTPANVYLRVSG